LFISEVKTDGEIDKWILDISTSSLHHLLATWGEEFAALTVYCDKSKPIEHNKDVFDHFIGFKEAYYAEIMGKRFRVTYNLSKAIEFVDSKDFSEIQIADLFASSINYSVTNPSEDFSQKIMEKAENSIIKQFSVVPGYHNINPLTENFKLNVSLLAFITQLSKGGHSVIDSLPYFLPILYQTPGV